MTMVINIDSLHLPTGDLVESRVQQFNQTLLVSENALSKLFQQYPKNTALDEVLIKVATLNDIYRTSIWATYYVAEHIVELNIDPLIAAGMPEIVNPIALIRIGNKPRNNYSFATKYCAWHNPTAYPIYDGYVGQILLAYSKKDQFDSFYQYELWDYPRFKRIVENFRSFYNLTPFGFKDLDKFLWLEGKDLFNQLA